MSEVQLRNFLDGKPMDFSEIEDHEKRDVVEGYCTFVIEKVYKNFIRGADSHEAFIEAHVQIIDGIVYGTVDFLVVRQFQGVRDGCLVDLKTGFNDVTVPQNKQFGNYAVGAMQKHNINGKLVAIGYLPRVMGREIPYEKWELNQDDLKLWQGNIQVKAKKALAMYKGEMEPEYTAGSHCKFCPAEGKCPALRYHLNKQSDDLLSEKPMELPAVQGLTPAQKGKLLAVKDQIISFLDSVEASALADMMAGNKIEGWKLVLGATRRGWIKGDESHIAEQLVTRGIDNPWQNKLITLGEAEKKLGKGKITDLVEPTVAKLLLAPESDKRPAQLPDVASDNLLTDM